MFKRFPADPKEAHPGASIRRSSAGIAAGTDEIPSRYRTGSALFGNWSEMDKNHLEGWAAGVVLGGACTAILLIPKTNINYGLALTSGLLATGIGVIANIALWTTWRRIRDWQTELHKWAGAVSSEAQRQSQTIRNLRRSNAAWQEAAEQWRSGSRFGSGAEAARAPRGKGSRHPLGAGGGTVIDFPVR